MQVCENLVGVTSAIGKLYVAHRIIKTIVCLCFKMGDKTGLVRPGHICGLKTAYSIFKIAFPCT